MSYPLEVKTRRVVLGTHTHLSFYVRPDGYDVTWALAGTLVVRNEEVDSLVLQLSSAAVTPEPAS